MKSISRTKERSQLRCRLWVLVVGAVALIVTADFANADSLALYNTGMSDAATPLPAGAIDPHYTLTRFPDSSGAGPNTFVVADSIAIADWSDNNADSQWISSRTDQATFMNDASPGDYVFRTTFDLTGFNPVTAQVSGRWSTDDAGIDILINGTSTGFSHTPTDYRPYAFQRYSDFSIGSGFVPGLNTLDFLLTNLPLNFNPSINPMGLRVELSGTATPIPEPSTFALAAVAALGLTSAATRRRLTNPRGLRPHYC